MADSLAPTDRALIRWAYGDGKPLVDLAAVHRVSVRAMSRRIQKIVQRCESPEFGFVLARVRAWEPPMALVARACVLEGRSLRSAAGTLGMSIHEVRALRTVVLSMAKGVEQNETLAQKWRAA
jgi:transposase-like protein